MIPNHILAEIARRLSLADPLRIETIANAVGIDPALAADPRPSVEESAPALFPLVAAESDVISGAIPFELKLTALGHEATQTCRAVYSATLAGDVDRKTGQPIRVLGQVEINWQVLDWRDHDRIDEATGEHYLLPAPVWTDDFEGLLPTAVPALLLDQIEEQAIALEQARKSNP